MEIFVKSFEELSGSEVYEILKARSDVFTIEQGIHYPDMDDIDYRSIHVWMQDRTGFGVEPQTATQEGKLRKELVQAYLRLYFKEDEPGVVKMGRVLTREHGKGIGREIVSAGIPHAMMRYATGQDLHKTSGR